MIGNWLRSVFGVVGRSLFDFLLGTGVSPNQITCIGFALVLCNCALYLVHQDTFFFGLGLALSYATDGLDGAVARKLGKSTKFGGYLDAVIDRYEEIAQLLCSWRCQLMVAPGFLTDKRGYNGQL